MSIHVLESPASRAALDAMHAAPIRLLPRQQREIDSLKAAWQKVGALFDPLHVTCDECPHNRSEHEPRPYGDGVVRESYQGCTLGSLCSETPADCARYVEHLADIAGDSDL